LGFIDVDERLGVIERGMAKEDGVDQAEDRRICADADRERQHGHRREAGMAAQRTEAVADVAREMFDEAGAKLVACALPHLLHAAESDQRLPPRLRGRHAGARVLLDLLLDMKADLVIEPIFDLTPADERTKTPQRVTEHSHNQLTAVTSSTRLIARDMRR